MKPIRSHNKENLHSSHTCSRSRHLEIIYFLVVWYN